MTSESLLIAFGFLGSFSFGLTGVTLKLGVKDQNIFYGILLRVLGSLPFLLLFNVLISKGNFLVPYYNPILFFLVFICSTLMISVDLLLMYILKKKSVGVISSLTAVNPIFTILLLMITGTVQITLRIIFLTLLIIGGVLLVTFEKVEQKQRLFDLEAILYGLLIALLMGTMLFIEIRVLEYNGVTGYSYSLMKVTFILILGLILYPLNRTLSSTRFIANKTTTRYLLLAGFLSWGLGAALVYTAFNGGPVAILTPIVGINPLFAVVISISLRQESLNFVKGSGILMCVVGSILLVS